MPFGLLGLCYYFRAINVLNQMEIPGQVTRKMLNKWSDLNLAYINGSPS